MINGLWTIAELQDLLAEKDAQMSALDQGWRDFEGTWGTSDKAAHDAWSSDYATLKGRYGAARAVADAALTAAMILPDAVLKYVPADGPYRFVRLAMQTHHGAVNPGDLRDLWNRLAAAKKLHAAAIGEPPPVFELPVPQRRPGTDVDESIVRSVPKLAWWAAFLALVAGSGALIFCGGAAVYLLMPKRARA